MANEHVQELTDADFADEVLHSETPVLVDFWAPWCGPCRMVGPTIDAVAEKFVGRAKIGKLNVDENQQTAESFHVEGIPTVLIFQGGQVVQSMVGVRSAAEYEQALDQSLAGA